MTDDNPSLDPSREEVVPQSQAAGSLFAEDAFSEDVSVPEAQLPITRKRKHLQTFQTMSFLVIGGLVALVIMAALLATVVQPTAGPLATDIAKTALPALITLLGTAIAWAFRSEE